MSPWPAIPGLLFGLVACSWSGVGSVFFQFSEGGLDLRPAEQNPAADLNARNDTGADMVADRADAESGDERQFRLVDENRRIYSEIM